ncbi:MAG: OsmC family protein [Gammaproteobacteria bacterium]
MSIQSKIKTKFERSVEILTQKPDRGISTLVSTTRVIDGLACETTEGDWTLKSDMPAQVGGTETGPTPGVFGRAALGSCLAMGYMLWASKLEVPIDSLEIEVQADSDDGGMFGTSDSPAGYTEVRYIVRVTSSASEEEIYRVLDAGGEHDPYLDIFSRAIPCKRTVEINQPETA